ncbi:hypothetical protein FOZ61_002760 [Perkinsus olseni]|uniref:Uncharacterized protein n=1 Tax=Perkinsus olseni TaxID=32597 RepID=A0A7J6MEL1_PEROL|nr:hypothetical protein FOZ61_002760 [Perkinsus olseni]KAF4675057.1 hypothetical protein FOL46_002972 [Perkinsus olseni]
MITVSVQVPQGATGGSTIQIIDPTSGRPFQVQVPAGLKPGDTFNVDLGPTIVQGQPVGGPNQPYGGVQHHTSQAPPQTVIINSGPGQSPSAADAAGSAACCAWCAIQVPQGASGGSTLQITDPATGRPMQVQVPAGLNPGDTFNVEVAPTIVTGHPYDAGYGGYDSYGTSYQHPPHQTVIITDSSRPPVDDNAEAAASAASCCLCLSTMLSCCLLGEAIG